MVMYPGIEGGSIAWQVFKPYPEFLLTLKMAFLVIVRRDRPINLGAGCKPQFHRTAGQPVGILPL